VQAGGVVAPRGGAAWWGPRPVRPGESSIPLFFAWLRRVARDSVLAGCQHPLQHPDPENADAIRRSDGGPALTSALHVRDDTPGRR
jgi:hypothetical protein